MPLAEKTDAALLVRNLVNTLVLLAQHLRIYRADNRLVAQTAERLQLLLERHAATHDRLQLTVGRNGLLYAGEFVERSNTSIARFAGNLFMHGVAQIGFEPGVTPAEVAAMLGVLQDKPQQTWEAGGMAQALRQRNVERIWVKEATDRHLRLHEAQNRAELRDGGEDGDLWGRFAQGLAAACEVAALNDSAAQSPVELAALANNALAERPLADKQQLGRELASLLTALQHENIHIYRSSDLQKLLTFVNNLSYDLKRLFLDHAGQLALRSDFAADFYAGLSDETIMDALLNASLRQGSISPMLVSLLGKLVRQRGLLDAAGVAALGLEQSELELQARELLRPDDVERFVPERYREVLLAVLGSETPAGELPAFDPLRATLEPEAIERHFGQVLLEILAHDPDARHLPGLSGHLQRLGQEALARDDFAALTQLWQLCGQDRAGGISAAELATPEFLGQILAAARRCGKARYGELRELLLAIGPVCIEPLLRELSAENNRAVRYCYIECLKQFGAAATPATGPYLQDGRWYVQRNMLYLLRELNDPAALPLIRPHLHHPHPRVRTEALKAGLRLHDPEAEKTLLDMLAAERTGTQLGAVPLARLSASPRVFEALAALLRSPGLVHYRFELKRSVVQTLAESSAEQALPLLVEVLHSHNLLHPRQHEQLKLEIVRALERGNSAAVRPVLEQLAATAGGEVVRLAAEQLRRRHGGER